MTTTNEVIDTQKIKDTYVQQHESNRAYDLIYEDVQQQLRNLNHTLPKSTTPLYRGSDTSMQRMSWTTDPLVALSILQGTSGKIYRIPAHTVNSLDLGGMEREHLTIGYDRGQLFMDASSSEVMSTLLYPLYDKVNSLSAADFKKLRKTREAVVNNVTKVSGIEQHVPVLLEAIKAYPKLMLSYTGPLADEAGGYFDVLVGKYEEFGVKGLDERYVRLALVEAYKRITS